MAAPESFIFCHVKPVSHYVFRCVARYGYTDPMEREPEWSAVQGHIQALRIISNFITPCCCPKVVAY
jgi:hypothetical protein